MTLTESVLFTDEQAAKPVAFCRVCGGEKYAPGRCLRCERRNQ